MKTLQTRLLALLLALGLLLTLTGCGKSNPSGSEEAQTGQLLKTLPTLYIDGKAYPVTVEDGIRGLEQVHDGVISLWDTVMEPEKVDGVDVYITRYLFGLFRPDGTQDPEYTGERKIWLSNSSRNLYFTLPQGMRALWVQTAGLPFPDGLPEDETLWRSKLEENGFFEYRSGEYLCFFTEAGAIDVSTPEFREFMRQTVRENKDFAGKAADEAWLEDYLDRDSGQVSLWAAGRLLLQALEDGSTRIVCVLSVTFDADKGFQTSVGLGAPEEMIRDWYARWSPAFGDGIQPLHD